MDTSTLQGAEHGQTAKNSGNFKGVWEGAARELRNGGLENQEKREVKEEGTGKQCRYSTQVKKANLKHVCSIYFFRPGQARKRGSNYSQHSPPVRSQSKANL